MHLLRASSLRVLPVLALVAVLACQGPGGSAEGRGARELGAPTSLGVLPRPLGVQVRPGQFRLEDFAWVLPQDVLRLREPVVGLATAGLDPDDTAMRKALSIPLARAVALSLDGEESQLGSEGYHLVVDPDAVRLSAATPVGLFYGAQTLRQLVREPLEPGGATWLPCVEIIDRPRFPWRGQLLDVSRHFLPIDVVRTNIDRLAELKMNVFHWHLTEDQGWRIETSSWPNLTSVGAWRVDRNHEPWWGRAEAQPGEEATYGGFYTKDEIRDLVGYAADRGITIVPEVDVPGHSRAIIAAYPELSCDGVQRAVATGGIMDTNTLCPGKDVTFTFLEEMLAEVTQLFPSEYFHIGGDECNKRAWSECPDCAARMQAEDLADTHELQSWFIKRCEDILARNGKRLIGWDEILEGGLAPNAAVMSWRGEAGGITSAKAGHEVVMSPNSAAYLDLKQGDPATEPPLGYSQLLLRTAWEYDPVPAELTDEEASLILGFQGNLWGESIQHEDHLTYMLLPRLYAIAEGGWSQPDGKDWDDFVRRVEVRLEHDLYAELWPDGVASAAPADPADPLESFYARNPAGTAFSPAMYQVAFDVDDSAPGAGLAVSLSTEHGTVAIRYTLDGSEPTAVSPLYTTPLRITETTTLRAAAFRDGKRLGRISTRQIDLHLALGADLDLLVEPSPRYPGDGAAGLVDGRLATASHLDPRWLGFEATDLVATVDLGSPQPVSAVTLECLEAQKSWIFLPREVTVELSTDGATWTPAAHLELDATTRTDGEDRRHALRLPLIGGATLARHVRLTATSVGTVPAWHAGAGGKPWIFVDELVVD